MKLLLFIILITVTGCASYQWVSTEVKITTYGDKIHIRPMGKPRQINDTTVTGLMISRKRINP